MPTPDWIEIEIYFATDRLSYKLFILFVKVLHFSNQYFSIFTRVTMFLYTFQKYRNFYWIEFGNNTAANSSLRYYINREHYVPLLLLLHMRVFHQTLPCCFANLMDASLTSCWSLRGIQG